MNGAYTLKNFIPLLFITCGIIIITIIIQTISGNLWNAHFLMRYFMASFFLVFGAFKIINLNGFASAYAMYDVIAKRIFIYGYLYPFIELVLGVTYLIDWYSTTINMITLVIMIIGSIGVLKALMSGRHLRCACLGTVFEIPITYVTLAEDLIMAGMALLMLINHP